MFNFLKRTKLDSSYTAIVEQVNALEPEIKALSDTALNSESQKLKWLVVERVSKGEPEKEILDEILPRAFALVREAAKRTLGQRHFDVQLIGGAVLHSGAIAEMRTGEGKTLAATLPAYLNALAGKGVHVVTVNEYLAKRDTNWMGQIYHALGLTVSCLVHEGALQYDPAHISPDAEKLIDKERDTTGSFLVQKEYLRPISRREAYQADITYGTNHEFGFDYLRDNLAHRLEDQVQRRAGAIRSKGVILSESEGSNVDTLNEKRMRIDSSAMPQNDKKVSPHRSAVDPNGSARHYAIIDEVDSILIDEARTPLIIAAPDTESSQFYKTFARVSARLEKETDYLVDEKLKAVSITEAGIDKVEKMVGIANLYGPENLRLTHYLTECLRAQTLFQKDRDYVVKNGEIIIVDQFTGRLMVGRRYSGGLHQAIEAKEGVAVQQESRTYGQISIQNYFRLYGKISGMTGTAQTSAEEFHKVYGLEVITIPTNQPMIRADQSDLVYKSVDAKYTAIIKDIKERNAKGQPILIGTVSIEKNEELDRQLSRAGLKHEVLNAKNNEREGAIIAQAGKPGAITVATNMAGRGVDIILGGNPPEILDQQKVKEAGGVHVIGTERHESRRIDNQLRGRSGRQGDPGSSQFFLSMEDDLMRIFGGDRMKGLMQRLHLPDDMPIQAGMLTRAIGQAQSKVEGHNFDARKHLLDYDDVLNKQRLAIYRRRQEILETKKLKLTIKINQNENETEVQKSEGGIILNQTMLSQVLSTLDMFWMTHLEDMEALAESVRLRAVGQHDPLVEYRREGHQMFQQLLANFDEWLRENKEKLLEQMTNDKLPMSNENPNSKIANLKLSSENATASSVTRDSSGAKIGRNDPCYCGSGKKFKKCHGK